jgi:hypothetical protein
MSERMDETVLQYMWFYQDVGKILVKLSDSSEREGSLNFIILSHEASVIFKPFAHRNLKHMKK